MTGGKREGAGRPVSTNPKSVIFKIRLTQSEHQKLLRLGGSVWVRGVLDSVPAEKSQPAPERDS